MKNYNEKRFLIFAFIGGLGMMMAGGVAAQTFTTLHDFTGSNDGANPAYGALISSGNALYGTASQGGAADTGSVFKINSDGSGFTNLYSFMPVPFDLPSTTTNTDGADPVGGLILSGNTLYGTAYEGGVWDNGTVFRINTDGTGFTNLHTFTAFVGQLSFPLTNSDGGIPHAGLVLSGNTLFGTAQHGGIYGYSTVFSVNTDGTGFTNLHSFDSNDGNLVYAGLLLSSNILYGTTEGGGNSGYGTVFSVYTDGSGFTNLYSFTNGNDGAGPFAGLSICGNTLYGTASHAGVSGGGTVFKINTGGTGFGILHSFPANGAGANPYGVLAILGNSLYGTTSGTHNVINGTVFSVHTDGTGFTNLYNFSAGTGSYPNIFNQDGANPEAGLNLIGDTLYGTADYGGSSGKGTIYSLSFAPQLAIASAGTNVILTWPTNVAGFDYTGFSLQSTTNLASTNWSPVSPSPVVMNGQNTVTNTISGAQMFYRLSQ